MRYTIIKQRTDIHGSYSPQTSSQRSADQSIAFLFNQKKPPRPPTEEGDPIAWWHDKNGWVNHLDKIYKRTNSQNCNCHTTGTRTF